MSRAAPSASTRALAKDPIGPGSSATDTLTRIRTRRAFSPRPDRSTRLRATRVVRPKPRRRRARSPDRSSSSARAVRIARNGRQRGRRTTSFRKLPPCARRLAGSRLRRGPPRRSRGTAPPRGSTEKLRCSAAMPDPCRHHVRQLKTRFLLSCVKRELLHRTKYRVDYFQVALSAGGLGLHHQAVLRTAPQSGEESEA